ncbi:bactofilin family protein [Schauerella aestuarii]|uniref:polymer-forming cytoskeletal protein n=1 Tax=Schauerella aestuarii TaxID=2511204 RepID=UPI00136BA033|nr:polymer-forming cytoskeletal protein [Achromobacter aestuarii]MYZ45994.1 hypothetical protein [Achromobacter aestuarii]
MGANAMGARDSATHEVQADGFGASGKLAHALGARRHAQRGFALAELALATALAVMVAIWGASKWMQQVEDAAATATGVWYLEIKRALDGALLKHFDALAAFPAPDPGGAPPPPFAAPLAPTLAELQRAGFLSVDFPAQPPLGGEAALRFLAGAGCPGEGCRIDAVAYSRSPLTSGSLAEPNDMAIAQVLAATQGYGGAVQRLAPARLQGTAFSLPNPPASDMTTLAPGTVAIWAGLDRAGYDRYLRVRDARDPDFQGPLSVAGGVRVGGNAHLAGGAQIDGSAHFGGDAQFDGDARVNGRFDAGGDMHVAAQAHIGGNATVYGDAHMARNAAVGGQLHVNDRIHGRYLLLGGGASYGAACPDEGLIARGTGSGLLVCRNGSWRGAEGGFGGAYSVNSIFGCRSPFYESTANPFTGACSCPAGFSAVPTSWGNSLDDTSGLTRGFVCIAPP